MDELDVEDIMYEAGVFYNGLRDESSFSHMDSYMTCFNWDKLEDVWNKIVDKNSKEEWIKLAKYWDYQSYISPNCGMMSSFICGKMGIKRSDLV
jgi:hypothetical protein